jgi:hypothetical protein
MAEPDHDRTRTHGQRATQRIRVIICLRTLDHAFDRPHRLIREALQPQDSRQNAHVGRLLVSMKSDDAGSGVGGGLIRDDALDVAPRVTLIALIMIRKSDHSIADELVGGR